MAKNNKADMSCARVKKYTASDVSKAERHNERKNETYENMNVIEERIPYNVHFKKPFAPTYMEQLKQMETDGLVSLRGLRKDATLFNEIVIDVNTMYFERNCSAWRGCAYYLFPAEWCGFAGYGIFD
ncbi:Plasmid recombination enzyme [[Ruminococcus] torques]|nr:Plasmid recombination enzyme [[Ruminococcus] torques]